MPLVWLAACAGVAAGDGADLQPGGFYEKSETKGENRLELAWPILEWTRAGEGIEWLLRPLLHSLHAPDQEKRHRHFLYPFFIYRAKGEKVTGWVLPIYFHSKRPKSGGGSTRDDAIFPLFFKGQDRRGQDYMALLPFGGTLRDIFLKDRIDFFTLFYIRTQKGDLRTYHVLGPLMGWSKGEDIHGGRIWPLVGEQVKEGKWRRGFFLWPFIHHYKSFPESGKDNEGFIVVPLFARRREGASDHWSVLFPFFGFSRNHLTGIKKWTVLWPFVEITSGKNRGIRVWPFAGVKRNPEGSRRFGLWPLYHRLERKDDAYDESGRWLLPFYWSKEKKSKETGEITSHWQFWPLVRSERTAGASRRLALLALLPWRDPAGAEKIYAPFWEFYVRQSRPGGDEKTYAFWRLYRREKEGERRLFQLAPLFKHERQGGQRSRWSFLCGAVQSERTAEGRCWKLFYVVKLKQRPR